MRPGTTIALQVLLVLILGAACCSSCSASVRRAASNRLDRRRQGRAGARHRPRCPRHREQGSGCRRRRAWGRLGGWFHERLGQASPRHSVRPRPRTEPRICESSGLLERVESHRTRPERNRVLRSVPPPVSPFMRPLPLTCSIGTMGTSATGPTELEHEFFTRRDFFGGSPRSAPCGSRLRKARSWPRRTSWWRGRPGRAGRGAGRGLDEARTVLCERCGFLGGTSRWPRSARCAASTSTPETGSISSSAGSRDRRPAHARRGRRGAGAVQADRGLRPCPGRPRAGRPPGHE